ncbi:MAG TPA: serine protease [Polyangia bacterium]|nr:serine protease [Polyangia bacterium]
MATLALLILTVAAPSAFAQAGPAGAYAGSYADDFSSLSARTRNYDDHPESVFSYCARNTAVYECLSYAADGTVRRNRQRSVLHGTAFAYQRQTNDTLLLTNDHVAAWPSVTDSGHPVEGVPTGCKLVSQSLALVDNEHDDYPRDDVPATVVVTDPQLDVAILRAHAPLQVMPWKVGRSADLRERNVVEVRGFPLGAFRATNIGKVVSAHDHDDYGDWDHDDFVIDALLSSGNSGSPVLAVSRATGEYELVGIFHAGYSQGSALNVVIGIDQVRDLMTTLKRSARERQEDLVALNGSGEKIRTALGPLKELFFPFGGLVANIRTRPDGTLLFALFSKDFPLTSDPLLVLEDASTGPPSDLTVPGRVWVGAPRGLKDYAWSALPPDVQSQLTRALGEMANDAIAYAGLKEAREADLQSRQSSDRVARLNKAFARATTSRSDTVQSIEEIAEKLAPPSGVNASHFAQLFVTHETPQPALAAVAAPAPIAAIARPAARQPVPSAQR